MKNILLILTGGTIGSMEHNGIIAAAPAGKCRITELYQKKYGDVHFTVRQPLNILSENLSLCHWETLINFILSCDLSDFDGMIITHGSDTLSYSSAMLSFCLRHLSLPVVITAANYVPDDRRSNALANLRAAVIMIGIAQRGTFTVYQNDGDTGCTVFLPTRLCEADRFGDHFSSADRKCIGTVKNDHFIPCFDTVTLDEIARAKPPVIAGKLSLKNHIMLLRPYPSMDYRHLIIPEQVCAVLHITYHSATVSAAPDNSVLTLMKQCRQKNLDLYLASFKKKNHAVYETDHLLLQEGAAALYDITNESAYAKLLLAYNGCADDPHQWIHQNLYFEIM